MNRQFQVLLSWQEVFSSPSNLSPGKQQLVLHRLQSCWKLLLPWLGLQGVSLRQP